MTPPGDAAGVGAGMSPMPAGGPPPPPPPIMLHDVTVVTKKETGKTVIAPVPPEEFGVSKLARSIAINDAPYCFHSTLAREDDLIKDGYDEDQVRNLPVDNDIVEGSEAQTRDTVSESTEGNTIGLNPPNRRHRIVEHYCWLDYKETGKAQRYKVVTAGGSSAQILKRKGGKLAVDEIDYWPFAAMTPVIQTHRFFGRSVADLVMDIQRIKSVLLRGVLDNTYLLNNQRMEISESHSSDSTLDDLLSNRPGGVVRTKMPGGLNAIVNQPIGEIVMGTMAYMDQVREDRTGVSRVQQGISPDSLQNVGQDLGLQMMTAAQQKIKLIARIFAETGIRDLFLLVHAIVRQNSTAEDTVKLRGKWITVNPRDWKERRDMTVTVGLGNGDKPQQLAFMGQVLAFQEKAIANPTLGLIKAGNIYNALKKFLTLGGEKAVDQYFTDPDATNPDGTPANPPPDTPPDPDMEKVKGQLAILQASAQSDIAKTQADIQANQQKIASDIALGEKKFEMERELAIMGFQMRERDRQAAVAEKQAASVAPPPPPPDPIAQAKVGLDARKVSMEEQKAQHEASLKERELSLKVAEHNKRVVEETGGPLGAPSPVEAALGHLGQVTQAIGHLAAAQSEHRAHLSHLAAIVGAPKRVVRDEAGKVIGVEVIHAGGSPAPDVPQAMPPPSSDDAAAAGNLSPLATVIGHVGSATESALSRLAAAHAEHSRHLQHIAHLVTAPKRVVRGADGKVVGVETVTEHHP